jgi:hypothetical protein
MATPKDGLVYVISKTHHHWYQFLSKPSMNGTRPASLAVCMMKLQPTHRTSTADHTDPAHTH